jgi:hypothetical protein
MVRYMFDLQNENGFFCMFFFFMTLYIFCRKRKKLMYLKDNKWKFKSKNGWEDYFILNTDYIHLVREYNRKCTYTRFGHLNVPKNKINLNTYKKYIKEVYKLEPNIITLPKLPEDYNSIFIRGGDKILREAKKIPSLKYFKYLLKLDLKSKNIFVHSDDNLIVLEIKKHVMENNLDYNIFSITDEGDNGGAVVRKDLKYRHCKNLLSVDEMSKDQKHSHVIKMLTAIEIMKKSDNVILSYDSNTSRFMKLYFECPVYNVNGKTEINLKSTKHPAYGF